MRPDVQAIEDRFSDLPPPPRGSGTVDLIVLRLGGGEHGTPASVEVTVDGGLEGDRWSLEGDPERGRQVTLMMTPVARLLAGDKPLHLPGDNFLVDLDLGEEALPVGARVALGDVVLEITEHPHAGCLIFSRRLGSAALRWVNHADVRSRRLRGVNCRVIEGGRVELGDAVKVL